MAYAISLRLDEETEQAVRQIWKRLADEGISDDMVSLGYPPHLSLAVLDDALPQEDIASALADHPKLPVRISGVRNFPETKIVWLAVDGGSALHDLHHKVLARLPSGRVDEHYRLGNWTPHVTLQMNGDVVRAISAAERLWPGPRQVTIVGMDLVRFLPVNVLESRTFA